MKKNPKGKRKSPELKQKLRKKGDKLHVKLKG